MKSFAIRIEPKVLLIRIASMTIIAILAYYALKTGIHGLRYFINYPDINYPDNTPTSKLLLLPHIGTGFIALILGPWQFWKGLRNRYLHTHRWMGRIYVGAVTVSSFLGLYMAITNDNLVFSTGITGLALAWIITGILACVTIKRGLVQEHREWMMRNYVLTFAFVSYRIGLKYMLGEGFIIADTVIMSWLCWVPQLFVTELFIQISHSKLFKKKGKSFRQSIDSGMVISAE